MLVAARWEVLSCSLPIACLCVEDTFAGLSFCRLWLLSAFVILARHIRQRRRYSLVVS